MRHGQTSKGIEIVFDDAYEIAPCVDVIRGSIGFLARRRLERSIQESSDRECFLNEAGGVILEDLEVRVPISNRTVRKMGRNASQCLVTLKSQHQTNGSVAKTQSLTELREVLGQLAA